MSCGVGCRYTSDLVLLWRRPAATALVRPLAWELPYAVAAALKRPKKKKKKSSDLRFFSSYRYNFPLIHCAFVYLSAGIYSTPICGKCHHVHMYRE